MTYELRSEIEPGVIKLNPDGIQNVKPAKQPDNQSIKQSDSFSLLILTRRL